MCSTHFTQIIYGLPNPADAYDTMVANAKYSRADQPYDDAISATTGFTVFDGAPMTLDEATRMIEDCECEDHVDGIAEGVPLLARNQEPLYEKAEPLTFRLDVPARVLKSPDGLMKLVREAGVVPEGFEVTSVHASVEGSIIQRVVETVVHQGETETRFFIMQGRGNDLPRWDAGYPSVATACEAIETHHGEYWKHYRRNHNGEPLQSVDYRIISVTQGADGQPLAHSTVTTEMYANAKVVLQGRRVVRERAAAPQVGGWLFHGGAGF